MPFRAAFRSMRYRNYRLFAGGQLVSLLARTAPVRATPLPGVVSVAGILHGRALLGGLRGQMGASNKLVQSMSPDALRAA